jgi:oligoendopeptidase F
VTPHRAAESEAGAGQGVPERRAIDAADRWNLEALYADPQSWEADFAALDTRVRALECRRGTLSSPENVAGFLEDEIALSRVLDRLYSYAHMRLDEDTTLSECQARLARIRSQWAAIGGRLAWSTPEILANPEERLRQWLDSPALHAHRFTLVKLLRRKAHTLSDKEETLLAQASDVFAAAQDAFTYLTDADMRFPEVADEAGRRVELSHGRYGVLLQNRDRRVRKDAFDAMYRTFGGVRNTLASTLSSSVKLHNYLATARGFPAALEAALHENQIPAALYRAMIAAARRALPQFYKYMAVRRQALGLDALDMYDLWVPIVAHPNVKMPYAEGCARVAAACAPLGAAYGRVLQSAFSAGWIDVRESRGKRSGAYSGGCYDSLPYILTNYQDRLNDVFTLAHELGHSLHSWLARHAQPYQYAQYAIFVAEIASTLNEALLLQHLLDTSQDRGFKAYLLNHFCDTFRSTVYRQTMFAEFELKIHEMAARGEALTADVLCREYGALNAEYYGPSVKPDPQIALEWARIPHFYAHFYVYQYATSFCASQIFVRRLGAPEARDRYLDLLRAGGADDPLNLVQAAGVDLTDPATLDQAFARFGAVVDELSTLIAAEQPK